MTHPITNTASQDPLSEFIVDLPSTLMAAPEWTALQALDLIRADFDGFLANFNDEEKLEYVRLQRAWIEAQQTVERAIAQFTQAFEHQAMGVLRAGLKTLTGQDIDPTVAKIHTRYLQPSQRVRRATNEDEVVKVASLTLWDAACRNYDGLTGWSYPGRTGLADASYLDSNIDTSAGEFIALVRRLDLGGQLKRQLNDALRGNAALGSSFMGLASAEFEFALIEALKNTTLSRIDRSKYEQVKRALAGAVRWNVTEVMRVFVPHGLDNISWLPQTIGLTGQYVAPPQGDCLSIPHLVFSVSGCAGAFSFFPNRPGGTLRHHDSARTACEEFHVAFHGLYLRGKVDWLYQMMSLRDAARLIQLAKVTARPPNLNFFARLVYELVQSIPKVDHARNIGYVRVTVQKTPVVALYDLYIERCRANLQELANATPGFMPTLIELFQTVLNEVLNLLLIPVPGALKGLGRARTFGMFVALSQSLVEGGLQAIQGEPGDLLQALMDVADLLVSGRLHTRLARSAQRRNQRLYQQLSQPRSAVPGPPQPTGPPLLERMLGTQDAPVQALANVLDVSGTTHETLNQVWEGATPSASLAEATHRFRTDRLIEWVADGAAPEHPTPVGAVEVMAPLLTQLEHWPAGTALSITNPQGLELRRYSKNAAHSVTDTVSVTVQENYQFAYATPRRLTPHLPSAIVALLPGQFPGGEPLIRQHLAAQAKALGIDLFDALTRFALASRQAAQGASASVRRLLPDRVAAEGDIPAVVAQLQSLHPHLSQARLLEVLRGHPLSEHQQTQLLESQLQPEALYLALRAARRAARREAIVDGIFHGRRFDRQTQNWAAAFAQGIVSDLTGRALVVSPAGRDVPYVAKGRKDRTLVVIDHRQGRFSAYDPHTLRSGEMLTGVDSFYDAVVRQLSGPERTQLRLSARQAIADLRQWVGSAVLRNRALDASFYPYRREITQYARAVDTSGVANGPDALGFYRLGSDHYLFIEGKYFLVTQADPAQPWRVQHPSLSEAYAPALTHNGAGAWRHEWENPLTWEGQRPFYRLGPLVRGFSPDDIEMIQQISGITSDILRRVHVHNEAPPMMLMDVVERTNTHQRIAAGLSTGRDFFDQVLGEVGPERADELVGRAGVSRTDQITVLESKVRIDAPQMERLFFKALSHSGEHSGNPLARTLQRQFPTLPARIAEDCVQYISAAERQTLEAGRVPLRLVQLASIWAQYVRRARALEGIYRLGAASEDSARLALHGLALIKQWPAHLRVEVRHGERLVDGLGPADAPLKRVLKSVGVGYQVFVPGADGRLQASGNPGGFLVVLLSSLPPAEALMLGGTVAADINEIAKDIASHLARHVEQTDSLLGIRQPVRYNPPRRIADGRIGYPLSGGEDWRPTEREQIVRMRELFPGKTDREVWDMLRDAGDSVRERDAMITYLEKERDTLNVALQQWRDALSSTDPDSASARLRALAVARIQRCWAKEGLTRGVAEELNLDDFDLPSLPTLGAHFGHVTQLSLRNNRLSELPARFLRSFPGLRIIYFTGNHLTRLPDLEGLSRLAVLNLSHNRLTFSLQGGYQLAALTSVRYLDLSFNPLSRSPYQHLSFYGLTNLRELNLRATGLSRLPRGAVTLSALRSLDLRDNQISELAQTDLFIYPEVHRAMNLRGNPLSAQARQLLRRIGERRGLPDVDFGLWEPTAAIELRADRWLALLAPGEVQMREARWDGLREQPMADDFFLLLADIAHDRRFVDLHYRTLRENVTRRIWTLLDEAQFQDGVERIADWRAYRYRRGGLDGQLLCLHELELRMLPQRLLDGALQTAGPGFLHYYRALHRLDLLDQFVFTDFAPQTWERACFLILSFRIALAQTLDLPLTLPGRFDVPIVGVDARSVNELRGRILRAEFGLNWPARVQKEGGWLAFLEGKYADRFLVALKGYDRALELATDRVGRGEMTEREYLDYISVLQATRRKAKDELVRQLTLKEWSDFVIG